MKKMKFTAPEKSPVFKFREEWKKKGFELIDITKLCKIKINCHGSCADINEPEENIYHIKILYRDSIIFQIKEKWEVIDERYVVYFDRFEKEDDGFIVFRKVKLV